MLETHSKKHSCYLRPVHLEISVTDAIEEYVCKLCQPDANVVRLT